MKYVRFEQTTLREAGLGEKWVQDRIAEDPAILGLGDVVLKDMERPQPSAGRLDLLLQDVDASRRYEVELQLGRTDETHIIRTIEYWDIERKRYPQYDHTAVIVAEDVTSRFLNVIGLFNGTLPLIAIQMNAHKVDDAIALTFTTVLNQMTLGLVDDDEEVREVTDRSYWEKRASSATVLMADEVLGVLREFDPELELRYNKFYIGLGRSGQPDNFIVFRPKKHFLRIEPRISRSDALEKEMDEAGLDMMDYLSREGRYRIRLAPGDIKKHTELVQQILKQAVEANRA